MLCCDAVTGLIPVPLCMMLIVCILKKSTPDGPILLKGKQKIKLYLKLFFYKSFRYTWQISSKNGLDSTLYLKNSVSSEIKDWLGINIQFFSEKLVLQYKYV